MNSAFKRPKLTTQQVGAAGEHFVAAEIHHVRNDASTHAIPVARIADWKDRWELSVTPSAPAVSLS